MLNTYPLSCHGISLDIRCLVASSNNELIQKHALQSNTSDIFLSMGIKETL